MKPVRSIVVLACALACVGCSQAEPAHRSYWQGKQAYEDLFETRAAQKAKLLQEPIAGVILPHHLFVGHEMAAAYTALSSQKPSIIVVIGPNHFSKGRGMIQTTDGSFKTPYGTVHPATETIDALVQRDIATIEPETIDSEHAISAHVAFIEKIFPNTTIVPLIVAVGTENAIIDRLADALHEILPEDALVIASVDFSHYMRRDVAEFHDEYSRATIERFSLNNVSRLEIDSPESIRALLRYLTHRGAQRMAYKEHTNSADFTGGVMQEETTSHFFMAFGHGDPLDSPFATVRFFGDTIVGRGIGENPFVRIKGTEGRFFYGTTLSIANLEGPITEQPAISEKEVSFAFDKEKTLDVLRAMGVTIANLANNHTHDAGDAGIADTIDALSSAGIAMAGYPDPCTTAPIINGSMAICSFTDTNGFLNTTDVAKAIELAKKTADYTLVSLHWGTEYSKEPRLDQRKKAADIIAAGADAIVGHGPHVAQPLEWIDGKPVFYSIGNFLFDQPDPTLSSGIVAGITFSPKGIGAVSFPIETAGGMPRLR